MSYRKKYDPISQDEERVERSAGEERQRSRNRDGCDSFLPNSKRQLDTLVALNVIDGLWAILFIVWILDVNSQCTTGYMIFAQVVFWGLVSFIILRSFVWCIKVRGSGKVMSGIAGATFVIQNLALIALWIGGFVFLIVNPKNAECSQLYNLTLLYMFCLSVIIGWAFIEPLFRTLHDCCAPPKEPIEDRNQ